MILWENWRFKNNFGEIMLLSFCKKCWQVNVSDGTPVASCESCGGGGAVNTYSAINFSRHIVELLKKSQLENKSLKTHNAELSERLNALQSPNAPKNPINTPPVNNELSDIDLMQTDYLASKKQHEPLRLFFTNKNIKTIFDYNAVNTNGYYDEASKLIGDNYGLFERFIRQITFAYQKNHTGTNLDLSKYNQNQTAFINKTLREFYNHTLFAKYNYNKQAQKAHIVVQTALPIKNFFMGGWLEWCVLSAILSQINELKNKPIFSCARGAKIQLPNGDKHELDIVFLNHRNELFIIECKTGEYRSELNKYLDLCKKLDINPSQFSLLVTDLNKEQASSMTAMYGINFISLMGLKNYVAYMLG